MFYYLHVQTCWVATHTDKTLLHLKTETCNLNELTSSLVCLDQARLQT